MSSFSVAVVKSDVGQFDVYGINNTSQVAMLLESINARTFELAVEKMKESMPSLKDDVFIPIEDAGLNWELGAYDALSGKIIALRAQEEEKREALKEEMNARYGPIWAAFMKQAEREGWAQSHSLYLYIAEDKGGNVFAYGERPSFDTRNLHWSSDSKVRGIRLQFHDGERGLQPTELQLALKEQGWIGDEGSVSYENRIAERVVDPADIYMTFGKYKDKRVGDMPISYVSYIHNKVSDPKEYQQACVEACKKVVARHNEQQKKGGV